MNPPRWLRYLPLLAPSLAALGACDRREFQFSDDAPIVGAAGRAASGGAPAETGCALERSKGPEPILQGQRVLHSSPARRELYAYVSDARARALRESGTLVTSPSAPGGPTPPVVTQLSRALNVAGPELRPLLEDLMSRVLRDLSTWPNPWALRLVNHAGSEHLNPVRIVLREDAWFVRINDGGAPSVTDLKNQLVSTAQAAREPGRIAAIFFTVGVPSSGSSGSSCEGGYRDIALAGEGMIESWSLGTPEISTRLDSDVQLLTELFTLARQCTSPDVTITTFHASTVCNTWSYSGALTEYAAYGWSLANPAELYKPSAQNLVNLVEALKGDRLAPDPFVVTPARAAGGGGMGGAAGSSSGGTSGEGGLGGASDYPAGAGGAD